MMSFNIRRIRKTHPVDWTLTLPYPSITAIFGPSGAGKSTFLQAIVAERGHCEARLVVDQVVWQDDDYYFPLEKRRVAFVKQRPYLFPHFNVTKNIHYGFKRSVLKPSKIFLDETIEKFGVTSLLEHYPHQLSGGECQRVAITQALLSCPKLLLLDESFSALDEVQKIRFMTELYSHVKREKIAMIYVTHALHEVAHLAEQVVSFQDNKIQFITTQKNQLTTEDES